MVCMTTVEKKVPSKQHVLDSALNRLDDSTVYHESFEAEKFRGFHGFLVLRETFFHENISVAIEKWALIAITMGIRESFFVKICVMH